MSHRDKLVAWSDHELGFFLTCSSTQNVQFWKNLCGLNKNFSILEFFVYYLKKIKDIGKRNLNRKRHHNKFYTAEKAMNLESCCFQDDL